MQFTAEVDIAHP